MSRGYCEWSIYCVVPPMTLMLEGLRIYQGDPVIPLPWISGFFTARYPTAKPVLDSRKQEINLHTTVYWEIKIRCEAVQCNYGGTVRERNSKTPQFILGNTQNKYLIEAGGSWDHNGNTARDFMHRWRSATGGPPAAAAFAYEFQALPGAWREVNNWSWWKGLSWAKSR